MIMMQAEVERAEDFQLLKQDLKQLKAEVEVSLPLMLCTIWQDFVVSLVHHSSRCSRAK